MGYGHYTAYCKNHKNDKWYEYNDTNVSEIYNQKSIISPTAYVLFLKRKDV